MSVRELIERLSVLDPDLEVVYFDRVTGDREEPVLHLDVNQVLLCALARPGGR